MFSPFFIGTTADSRGARKYKGKSVDRLQVIGYTPILFFGVAGDKQSSFCGHLANLH